jgi:hypothetical protein
LAIFKNINKAVAPKKITAFLEAITTITLLANQLSA